jgi:hypothetical protein
VNSWPPFFAAFSSNASRWRLPTAVFLQARDMMLSEWEQGRGKPPLSYTPNLKDVVWHGQKAGQRGLAFLDFYELNREVFKEKAKQLLAIMNTMEV